jgi:hypothetical protein
LRQQDAMQELTAPQEERIGGVLQAFATGFVALASVAMCWLMLFLFFGLPPIPLHSQPSETASAKEILNRTAQGITDGVEAPHHQAF